MLCLYRTSLKALLYRHPQKKEIMGLLRKDVFICLDCESTGLDTDNDRIIELAGARFNFDQILESYDSLINPGIEISAESQAIHNISQAMIQQKPPIQEILPAFLNFIKGHIIVGHSIEFDIALIRAEAKRCNISSALSNITFIDTLRLARLYGESPENSLQKLRQHFNIPEEGAHRAMSDVIVNIEVFKRLTASFKKTEDILERLKKPILLKVMPLGKHKGRKFSDIPADYLQWAANQNFDQDLLFSLRHGLKKRTNENHYSKATNPFSNL